MDKITGEFPTVNLPAATTEVKSLAPDNAELQSYKVSDSVGGQVDVVVGITYNSGFPTLVASP